MEKLEASNRVFNVDFNKIKSYVNKIQNENIKNSFLEQIDAFSNDKSELKLKESVTLVNELHNAKNYLFSEEDNGDSCKGIDLSIQYLESLTLSNLKH